MEISIQLKRLGEPAGGTLFGKTVRSPPLITNEQTPGLLFNYCTASPSYLLRLLHLRVIALSRILGLAGLKILKGLFESISMFCLLPS